MHVDDLPAYLAWIRFCSFHYYSYRLILINEFSGHSYPCAYADDAQAAIAAASRLNATLDARYSPQSVAAECALFRGDNWLQSQGINDHGMGAPVAGLAVIIVVFYFISWLVLRFWPRYSDSSKCAPALYAAAMIFIVVFHVATIHVGANQPAPKLSDAVALQAQQRVDISSSDPGLGQVLVPSSFDFARAHFVFGVQKGVTVRLDDVSVSLLVTSHIFSSCSSAKQPPPTPTELLRSISVTFSSGRISVLMGETGSGKTSLLSLLANQIDKDTANVSGRVLFQEQILSEKLWRRTVGYGRSFLSLSLSPHSLCRFVSPSSVCALSSFFDGFWCE